MNVARSIAALTAAAVVFGLAGTVAAETKLKFGLTIPDSPLKQAQGAHALKKYVEYRSDGAIKVDLIFAQLGGERELTEMIQQGQIQLAIAADGAVAGFYKPIQALSIPYLFSSSQVAWAFFESPFLAKMAEDMRQKTGIRVLNFSENGFRCFTNNVRPIKTPDDMKGIKMRTMESPVYMRMVQSMGGTATPISFSELVMSLQQGVVDGQENAIPDIYENRMIDVQKYVSTDEHVLGTNLLLTNDAFFSALPVDQQNIIREGARVYASLANALVVASVADYIEKMRGKGKDVHITTAAEKEMFRKVTQGPVKEYIVSQVGQQLVNDLTAAIADSEKAVYGR